MSHRKLKNNATYQGYDVAALEWRRSPGLQAEYGWVEVPYGVLRELVVEPQSIGWRAAEREFAGFADIRAWWALVGKTTSDRIPTPPEFKGTPGKLGLFGDLVLNTAAGGSARGKSKTSGVVRYSDVYVAESGIEELILDLKRHRNHVNGAARISISDIRRTYGSGALLGEVNARLRGRAWDPRTVDRSGAPWTLWQILGWMFSQLPGTPRMHPDSDAFRMSFNPPTNLKWAGHNARNEIETLLDRNGLEACLLRDGHNYLVRRRGGAKVAAGELQSDVNVKFDCSKSGYNLSYERKTAYANFRPPCLAVLGKRRVTRITLTYVPVFQDVDGRIYQLSDISRVWKGYTLLQVNQQVLKGDESAFSDVPPTPTVRLGAAATRLGVTPGVQNRGEFDGAIHDRRRAILRSQAYKLFAPSFMFLPSFRRNVLHLDERGRPDVETGRSGEAPYLADDDFAYIPWLPAMDFPAYKRELKDSDVALIQAGSTEKGDLGDFVLAPPTAWASALGEDFVPSILEVRDFVKRQKAPWKKALESWQLKINECVIKIREEFRGVINRSESVAKASFQDFEARRDYFFRELRGTESKAHTDSGLFKLGQDFKTKLEILGIDTQTELVQKYMLDNCEGARIDFIKAMLENQIKSYEKYRDDASNMLDKQDASMRAYESIYQLHGGVQAWHNVPWQQLDRGSYSLEPRTGLLKLNEPCVLIEEAATLDVPNATVIGAGPVCVTIGYERRENTTSDFTLCHFMADPNDHGPTPDVKFVGFARPVGVKPKVIVSPEMRLYETELGTPMNWTATVTDALGKANEVLRQAQFATGYSYDLEGFLKVELSGATSGVQFTLENGVAKTHVAVNSPNSVMPLGPPSMSYEQRMVEEYKLAIDTELQALQLRGGP